jgi:hypothetical protein
VTFFELNAVLTIFVGVFMICVRVLVRASQAQEFFVNSLGYTALNRPKCLEDTLEGAWLCGKGTELYVRPTVFSAVFPRSAH